MLCDIEVQDATTIVTDDKKAIEHTERDRWYGEEVHRGNHFPVITEKGKPARGRLRISRCPLHATRDHSLRDIKTDHEKLARIVALPTLGSQPRSGSSVSQATSTSFLSRSSS